MRAYRVAYDGRPFHGFQRQPDVPTVSDALLDALVELDVLAGPEPDARSRPVPTGYAAAGRTDAGVSALAQTVAFDAPDWLTPRAFDAACPDAVHVWATADAPADFHATHDAAARQYRYLLHAPPAAQRRDENDHRPSPAVEQDSSSVVETERDCSSVTDAALTRVERAASALSGHHDYHNLTPDDSGTVREVAIGVSRVGRILVLDVTADGFPRQLVRRLASVLRAAAADRLPAGRIDRLLGSEPLDGPDGVPPAAPEPLVLLDVQYPSLSFERDEQPVRRATTAFGERHADAAVASRVAVTIARGIAGENRPREP